MKIFFLFFAFMLSGCAILKSKRQSLWAELDHSKALSCERIDPPLNHLGLLDIMLAEREEGPFLLIKSKSRLGEGAFYTYPLPDSGRIDEESFTPANINPQSEWAGSARGVWGMYESSLGVESQSPEDKLVLSLRHLGNSKSAPPAIAPIVLDHNPDRVFIQEARDGLWLIDQKDSKFNLSLYTLDKAKGDYQKSGLSGAFFSMPMPLQLEGHDLAYVVLLEETGGELILDSQIDEHTDLGAYLDIDDIDDIDDINDTNDNDTNDTDDISAASIDLDANPIANTFQLQTLGEQGSIKLDLPTSGGVEKWSLHQSNKGFYLAFLEGDSLVGQATLHIANYQISTDTPQLIWLKTFPMNHVHIGDFEWQLRNQDKLVLHFLKWLDGEATLASFRLGQDGVIPLENKGVFPGGSTLMRLFDTRNDDGLYHGLFRQRDGAFWQFKVCQLNDD